MSENESYKYISYLCLDPDINPLYIETPLAMMTFILLNFLCRLIKEAKNKIKIICYPQIVSVENKTYCVFSIISL